MRIGLVGCVKSKKPVPAPAEDLYTSPLFLVRRRYVERTCDEWFVLSAKHGLVERDTVVDPYDVTLKTASPAERRHWSRQVLDALGTRLGNLADHAFEIHAGTEYRDYGLRSGLVAAGAIVEVPAEGLSLGEQLAFYGSANGAMHKARVAVAVDTPSKQLSAPRGSYAQLGAYLSDLATRNVTLSFSEIEQIIDRPLPASARRHRAWWANERAGSHSQARAWLDAGWHVGSVDPVAGWVRFRR